MQRLSSLPPPPQIGIEVVRIREQNEPGFLTRVSREVRTVDSNGRRSESLIYDEVDRPALDAVVILAHFVAESEGSSERFIVLRSATRPPIALRQQARSPVMESENRGLWELPAGLVEPAERGEEGLRNAAARELVEETGFSVNVSELAPLGSSTFPAPGICAERQFYFHVEVDPVTQGEPLLDGSPLEECGALVAVPIRAALQAASEGKLPDAKTELALRRLVEVLE